MCLVKAHYIIIVIHNLYIYKYITKNQQPDGGDEIRQRHICVTTVSLPGN